MFICNFTIKVDNEIFEEWLQWQKEEQIPEVMQPVFLVIIKSSNCLNMMSPEPQLTFSSFLQNRKKIMTAI